MKINLGQERKDIEQIGSKLKFFENMKREIEVQNYILFDAIASNYSKTIEGGKQRCIKVKMEKFSNNIQIDIKHMFASALDLHLDSDHTFDLDTFKSEFNELHKLLYLYMSNSVKDPYFKAVNNSVAISRVWSTVLLKLDTLINHLLSK